MARRSLYLGRYPHVLPSAMPPRVPILMYHKVDRCPPGALVPHHYVTPARFRNHLRALARFGFRSTTLAGLKDAFAMGGMTGRTVALTFDDGYLNFREHAAPALLSHGFTGTVFVVAGQLGGTNAWDTRNGDVAEQLLDAEDLRKLVQDGIEIGSHTTNHARLTEVGPEAARKEIVESKAILGQVLGLPVTVFCYPYGAQDEPVRRLVAEAGYVAACSVEKGWNDSTTDPYRWKRVNVRSDTSTPILFWKLWRQSRK